MTSAAVSLLAIGIILIIYGISANNSVSSDVSRFFTGSPTDRTLWLLIGGVAAAVESGHRGLPFSGGSGLSEAGGATGAGPSSGPPTRPRSPATTRLPACATATTDG